MSFPLFRRPGPVVFLDDDADYLEMLALVLPRAWQVRLYLRPAHCIHNLHREPPLWEIDAWNQQLIIDQWRQGRPLIPQILSYWSRSSERYGLTRVCVVDFSMPGMDGLQVLGELTEWQGTKVLLTGQADEQVAVRAFNRGLIDQFLPKQLPDISRRLVDAVETLLATPHPRHAQTWRASLQPEQHTLLRTAPVQQSLGEFAAARWVEYIAIGEPFGVLGLDDAGNASWLQLETRQGLASMAELAEVEGVPAQGVADIRIGRKLAALELRQSLAIKGPPELVPAFALVPDESLLGALFPIDAASLPAPLTSLRAWRASQPPRKVED